MPKNKDITLTNLKLEPYQIILRPIVTEKGYHRAEHQNTYYFEVHQLANKAQIKDAVEFLFDVKVLNVRTQHRKGKTVYFRRKNRKGKRRDWKKAIVKLHSESKINYF
ncbi:MAG: 50S ribosomal protein L23 [Planctomycetaceae bacterium]|jgi:large subunit ribosomal protein L23|nr:50S ribosomal protein L23 [Planctomycetaceae bacterium]